ncbi:MAG: ribosomal-processing cysteine protease Prp [Clostridia bacterium]|nr:ribosomal-processing cysteine protease Prp [Clostridia bacterium]
MTTVKFALDGDDIVGFSVSGHAGYAEEGEDIVCAAVSASVQMLELQIAAAIGEAKASFKVLGDAEIAWRLPGDLSEKEKEIIKPMMDGFFRFMQSVNEHYEDFLTLKTEVKKC